MVPHWSCTPIKDEILRALSSKRCAACSRLSRRGLLPIIPAATGSWRDSTEHWDHSYGAILKAVLVIGTSSSLCWPVRTEAPRIPLQGSHRIFGCSVVRSPPQLIYCFHVHQGLRRRMSPNMLWDSPNSCMSVTNWPAIHWGRQLSAKSEIMTSVSFKICMSPGPWSWSVSVIKNSRLRGWALLWLGKELAIASTWWLLSRRPWSSIMTSSNHMKALMSPDGLEPSQPLLNGQNGNKNSACCLILCCFSQCVWTMALTSRKSHRGPVFRCQMCPWEGDKKGITWHVISTHREVEEAPFNAGCVQPGSWQLACGGSTRVRPATELNWSCGRSRQHPP